MRLFLLVFGCILVGGIAFAQDADSIVSTTDSSYTYDDGYNDDAQPDSTAPPDSTIVESRNFDDKLLDDLKSDPSLRYKEPPTVAESIWDRFILWIGQLLEAIFEGAVTTNWGRVFAWVIGIVVLVVVIMMILKVNAFKVFYSGEGGGNFAHTVLDENIHEMDFEKLIQEAMAKNDFRTGVRLVFLYSLKMLSDKNLIHWDQGKTNHDYLNELSAAELKTGFNELNYYFEYAWYGNFMISREMFAHVQGIFNEWKAKLR